MKFTSNYKRMLLVSAAILAVSVIVGLFTGGMNMGVDFTGGTLVTIELHDAFDMDVVEQALVQNGVSDAQAVRTGLSATTQTMVDIRMKSLNDDAAESALRIAVLETIKEKYPQAEIKTVDRVDGVASAGLVRNAIFSILIAGVLILAYIWVRFELLSGVVAVLALLHDVGIMMAITCILRIPINSPFIAAILTIVGYSINNTIVVFDRIRETRKHDVHADKHCEEIVDKSIQATLTRSINTSITTLLTITMVYILGVESIKEFALPIIIGLLAGTYSSVFLAGPVWAKWYMARLGNGKKKKRRA